MPVVNYHTVNGQMVGQSTGSTFTQYLTDALGSVTATVNGKRVTNTYRYKPYGERLAKTGTGPDPAFQWAGDTGSRVTGRSRAEQYNRARHYGTRQAGWTSLDPIWPDESQYLYVSLNPSSLVDPAGFRGNNSNNRGSVTRGGRSVWYPAPGGRGRSWRPDPAYPRIDPNDSPYSPRPAPRPTPRRTPGRGSYPGSGNSLPLPWRPPGSVPIGYPIDVPFPGKDPNEPRWDLKFGDLLSYCECDYWHKAAKRICNEPKGKDCCFKTIPGNLPDGPRGDCIRFRILYLQCDVRPPLFTPPGRKKWMPKYDGHLNQICGLLNELAKCQDEMKCLNRNDPFWSIFRHSCGNRRNNLW